VNRLNLNALLIALGSAGDVYPFVALGLGLRARGHRVTLLTNGHFEPVVRRAGLDFLELGTDAEYQAVIERPEVWDPIGCIRPIIDWVVLGPMRRTFEIIADRNVPGATVVAAPLTALGARIAQEKHGVPLVTVALYPSLLRSVSHPPALRPLPIARGLPRRWNQFWYWLSDVALLDRLIGPKANAFRAELGLAPACRFLADRSFSPGRVLGLFPDWFGPPQPDWLPQVRLTGFPLYDASEATPLAPEVVEFFAAGEPPIVFAPGSAMRHGRAFFEAAVDACRQLGRRAALVSRFRDQIPGVLPGGIRQFDSVPFSRLFSHAAAVVHHGGIGTSAHGLAAGIPHLVMPMAYDQHDNAARLEELGVAGSLAPHRFHGPQIARALAPLLASPAVAARCRVYAERLRQADPLADSCRLIEQAASAV
jgi:rhamnosyltransferase subunit B